jgi:hypothetical protein
MCKYEYITLDGNSPMIGFCDEFAFRSSSSISETVKEDSMLWS